MLGCNSQGTIKEPLQGLPQDLRLVHGKNGSENSLQNDFLDRKTGPFRSKSPTKRTSRPSILGLGVTPLGIGMRLSQPLMRDEGHLHIHI